MSFGDNGAAAWEVDFAHQRLVGAARLERLIGRAVSYGDIVDNGCFAGPEDRALVRQAFSPKHGAVRRISLEQAVFRADGTSIRVSHHGFVRTSPDGTPVRITCVTRHSAVAARPASIPQPAAPDVAAALVAQENTLKTLSNELSATMSAELESALASVATNVTEALALFAERAAAVDRGVDDLAHARHAADSANLAKSQFLANMSHELRTPLNAIIGYAEMLQEDADDNGDATAVQDLGRILTAAKHLLSLINEILDLSKIEAGRMDVIAARFEPAEMLDELIETVRPLAEQNGNAISLIGAIPAGAAHTDAFKLRQCVLNLLSNACKFTRGGRIEILFHRTPINGVEQLLLTVQDTGIGMSKEHVSRLFQPFVQADPSITQQYGGTGLGLTITRRLAQLLGGDVKVESALGQGSAFTLHVPADFADASAALGAAAKIDELQGAQDAPLILVIEDEADARELAARALTRAGFAVQGVGGGEAGLALARAKAPALVLLDIFLPDRSGWRVLQSLKQDPKTQDIPVVVLSVNEDRAHALALGAAEHIVKPADRDMLAATVMRYARKRPAAEQTASAATVTRIAEAG
jgi:signal transduction histidine kinase